MCLAGRHWWTGAAARCVLGFTCKPLQALRLRAHFPSPASQAPLPRPASGHALPLPSKTNYLCLQGLKPGECNVAANPHAKRERELLGRRSYLKNFWYAAALSDSVAEGKPHGVGLMGRELVLWRGEDGAVQCIDNTCPHR